MSLRFSALIALTALAGCTWEGRPDGAEAVHSASDGYYEDAGAPQATPLGGGADAMVEPLGDEVTPPVERTQPPPTTGTADATSEVEEALTPGTEQ